MMLLASLWLLGAMLVLALIQGSTDGPSDE